jgi:hypothetical protein
MGDSHHPHRARPGRLAPVGRRQCRTSIRQHRAPNQLATGGVLRAPSEDRGCGEKREGREECVRCGSLHCLSLSRRRRRAGRRWIGIGRPSARAKSAAARKRSYVTRASVVSGSEQRKLRVHHLELCAQAAREAERGEPECSSASCEFCRCAANSAVARCSSGAGAETSTETCFALLTAAGGQRGEPAPVRDRVWTDAKAVEQGAC